MNALTKELIPPEEILQIIWPDKPVQDRISYFGFSYRLFKAIVRGGEHVAARYSRIA